MKKRVVLDQDCGSCAQMCHEIFELDEESEVTRVTVPEGADRECVLKGVETCPTECILPIE
jgi:ferredoxin